jgi:hypothetical protein
MAECDDVTRDQLRAALERLLQALRIYDQVVVDLTDILSRLSHH